MPITNDVLVGFAEDTGHIYQSSADSVDNVFVFTDGAENWEIINRKGPYIARHGGVLPGSNQQSRLVAILAHADVKEVVLDAGAITVNGTLNFAGKILRFEGDGSLTGTYTLQNAKIVSDNQYAWMGGTPTFTSCTNLNDVARLATEAAADVLSLRYFYDTTLNVFKFKNGSNWNFVPDMIPVSSAIAVSQAIAANRVVTLITVSNAAGLSAFKIGTTLAGEEISSAQSIDAGVDTPYLLNIPSGAGFTLYFGGIDSSTVIKIYQL
jgi:hypothetical protein